MPINYDGVQPSRLGAVNAAGGDENALFLKVFAGEVLTTFEANNAMMPLHRVRTITSGKSAQFPVTGVAAAAYHTPGESLFTQNFDDASDTTGENKYLSQVKHNERVISIDGVLTASAFLADIDEAKNHYEVRSIYSTEIGRQLAYTADKNLIRTVIAGAREGTNRFNEGSQDGTGAYSGAVINMGTTDGGGTEVMTETKVADGAAATGATLISGLFLAAELMDSKNVPDFGRYCILPPEEYYKLVNENKDAINRDYNPEGNGSVAAGEIMSVAGIRILKSNHIPSGAADANEIHASGSVNNDVFGSSGVGYGNTSFAETKGIIFQQEGVGTVKLMDLAMESEYFMERLGTLLMARYAMGHGVLREEACMELIVTA
tara:strand:- start:2533 stop:3660 length:1128 start_codon:yes stop_codon:yes gene_type:complete